MGDQGARATRCGSLEHDRRHGALPPDGSETSSGGGRSVDSRRRSFGAAPLTKSQLAALCSEMFTALMPLGPEAGPESSGGTPCRP